MTKLSDRTILWKALGKAADNWFDMETKCIDIGKRDSEKNSERIIFYHKDGDVKEVGLYSVIFSHEFAKAFWGSGKVNTGYLAVDKPAWRYHLQQMVLYKNPIDYLRKFVEEKE